MRREKLPASRKLMTPVGGRRERGVRAVRRQHRLALTDHAVRPSDYLAGTALHHHQNHVVVVDQGRVCRLCIGDSDPVAMAKPGSTAASGRSRSDGRPADRSRCRESRVRKFHETLRCRRFPDESFGGDPERLHFIVRHAPRPFPRRITFGTGSRTLTQSQVQLQHRAGLPSQALIADVFSAPAAAKFSGRQNQSPARARARFSLDAKKAQYLATTGPRTCSSGRPAARCR